MQATSIWGLILSACIYVCLPLSISLGIHRCGFRAPLKETGTPHAAELQNPAPLWQWLGLTLTSTYTPFSGSFCLALDTRVVWQKLKIKHLGLGCGQFSCASAVWGGGRGGWRQPRLSVLHQSHQGQSELLREQSQCHPEHVACYKNVFLLEVITWKSGGSEMLRHCPHWFRQQI